MEKVSGGVRTSAPTFSEQQGDQDTNQNGEGGNETRKLIEETLLMIDAGEKEGVYAYLSETIEDEVLQESALGGAFGWDFDLTRLRRENALRARTGRAGERSGAARAELIEERAFGMRRKC